MCNLYSLTKGQQAILELSRAMRDTTGNLPPMPGIFPDYAAPIVRTGEDGVRELALVRWGMPSSKKALLDAAKMRAERLRGRGKEYDFDELVRMAQQVSRELGQRVSGGVGVPDEQHRAGEILISLLTRRGAVLFPVGVARLLRTL